MRRMLLVVALVMAALMPARAAGPNLLELKTPYSADSVIGSEGRQTGHLWRTATALRHEMSDGGWPQTVIARFDRNVVWLLIPQMKTALETDLRSFSEFSALSDAANKLNPVAVGTETINGQRATKYRIAVDDPKAGSFNGFVWRTAQGVVMKIDGEGDHQGRKGTVHVAFRNVQTGQQDASLFEPPADFRRVAVTEDQIATVLGGLQQLQRLRGGSAPAR